jgi:integrase/recombinase XerD
MLTTYFKSAVTIARYRAGCAGPHLDRFVAWLAEKGYRRVSIRRHVREVVNFAAWAESVGLGTAPLNHAVLSQLHDYLTVHGRQRDPSGNRPHVYQSACVFVRFLEVIGAVRPETVMNVAETPALFVEFHDWMAAHRGTRDSTLASYRLPVENLLRTLGQPDSYSAHRLREFFLQQINPTHPAKSKNLATAMRMFLRFLIVRGDCAPGLDFAIPTVARWRLSALPKYLPSASVEALIASCDRSVPLGARDRAILLLIARLGLRASDVSSLQFCQLLWSKGTVRVAGKNRREVELPLPQEVGDAILHYLEHGRPQVETEAVFITTIAPFIPITRVVVGKTVARAIRQAGIEAPNRGAHLLRHSVATSMLGDGILLTAIGALLRHTSIETTAIYAKVDVNMLKEVVQPWPGAEP